MIKEFQDRIPVDYQVLETNAFFSDQITQVQKSEIRAWIQTMALEPSYFSNLLMFSLFEAFGRGIDAKVVHDAYSDFVIDNQFTHLSFLLRSEAKDRHQRKLLEREIFINKMNEVLPVTKTNIPTSPIRFTPFAAVSGRDHKKISIVDNIAYIGGVNMTALDSKRMDLMLKTNNCSLVNELEKIYTDSFNQEEVQQDKIIHCDDSNILLIDSGKRGKSIIMEHVYDLVSEETESILLISPYVPSGKLRKLMNSAVKRDVHVELITTGSKDAGMSQHISQMVHNFGQRSPSFNINRYPGIVHAKALIFGNHTSVIGSHNFDELFVNLGTEEISLLTHQNEIINQMREYALKLGWTYG